MSFIDGHISMLTIASYMRPQ